MATRPPLAIGQVAAWYRAPPVEPATSWPAMALQFTVAGVVLFASTSMPRTRYKIAALLKQSEFKLLETQNIHRELQALLARADESADFKSQGPK